MAELLEMMGVADADVIVDGAKQILSIQWDGKTFGILLEDYADQLLDAFFDVDSMYQEEIDDSSYVNEDAIIMYGLGFPNFERALHTSAKQWDKHGMRTNMQTKCTVEDFKSMLKGYDLIVIEEHGDFEWLGVPIIVTTERYTKDTAAKYAADIDSGRIYPVICESGTIYVLHPDFFSYYYRGNQLSGAVVWLGSCSGAKSSALSDAFLSAGATAVIGHSETVYTIYDYKLLNTSVSHMINGNNLSDALQQAKNQWGSSDREYMRNAGMPVADIKAATACPRMAGNGAVRFD